MLGGHFFQFLVSHIDSIGFHLIDRGLQQLAVMHHGVPTLGMGNNVVILVAEGPLARTKGFQYRVAQCIEPPTVRVSPDHERGLG